MGVLFAGKACVDPDSLAASLRDAGLPVDRFFGKANHFLDPLHRDPGTGFVLLRKDDLDAIDLTKSASLTFLDDQGGAVTYQKIALIRAECVSPGAAADPDAAYLCELADRRYFLRRKAVNTAYNVTAPSGCSYLPQTLNAGAAWTWQGVTNDLAAACGLGTLALPFAPSGSPENLTYWAASAWDALCDALDRIACGVKYDPVTDTFAVVRLGVTDAAADAARVSLSADRTWDGYFVDPVRAWLPEKVRVLFRRYPLPTDGTSPYYAADVALAATAGVEPGTFVQLHDDLSALGSTGAPSNAAAIATRAAERAADWQRKRDNYESPELTLYRDVQADAGEKILGATAGAVAVEDRGENRLGSPRTTLRSRPDGRLEGWGPLRGLPVPLPADEKFFVEITGGSAAAGYSGKRSVLTGPDAWTDAACPAPLTFASNIWRAKSNKTEASGDLPAIQAGQLVLAWRSGTYGPVAGVDQYECLPWGSQNLIAFDVVTKVGCVGGSLRVTTKTLRALARDLVASLDNVLVTEGGDALTTEAGGKLLAE